MKKILGVFLIIIMSLFGFTACTNGSSIVNNGNNGETGGNNVIGGNPNEGNENGTITPPVMSTSSILIAYFSCTNTTEAIAK